MPGALQQLQHQLSTYPQSDGLCIQNCSSSNASCSPTGRVTASASQNPAARGGCRCQQGLRG
eukprot:360999-Chlamydomonas_euryale.AAC.1